MLTCTPMLRSVNWRRHAAVDALTLAACRARRWQEARPKEARQVVVLFLPSWGLLVSGSCCSRWIFAMVEALLLGEAALASPQPGQRGEVPRSFERSAWVLLHRPADACCLGPVIAFWMETGFNTCQRQKLSSPANCSQVLGALACICEKEGSLSVPLLNSRCRPL